MRVAVRHGIPPRWPDILLPEPPFPWGVPIKRAPPNADGHVGGGPFGPSYHLGPFPGAPGSTAAPRPQTARPGLSAQERNALRKFPAFCAAAKFANYNAPTATADRAAQRRPHSARTSSALGAWPAHPAPAEGAAAMGASLPGAMGLDAASSTSLFASRGPPILETHEYLQSNNVLQCQRIMRTTDTAPGRTPEPVPSSLLHPPETPRPRGTRPTYRPRMVGYMAEGRGRVGQSRGLGGNPTAWRALGPTDTGTSEYERNFQAVAAGRRGGAGSAGVEFDGPARARAARARCAAA